MRVALVNTNRMRPPIGPLALDYLAEALAARGHDCEILDLCWEADPGAAIARFFARSGFGLVGVTLRNTDDCGFTSRQSFLPDFASLVETIRAHTDAVVAAGGAGFSVMPEQILAFCEAAAGVWGEGEFTLCGMADAIGNGNGWQDLPNLVLKRNGGFVRTPRAAGSLESLPRMSRRWVDNVRYFREGGQAGFETKRGCNGACAYCADPVAKGAQVRLRPPAAVASEIEALLEQGIDHLHTCDGEFNLPEWHGLAVCREIARRGLGERLRWYAYCSPVPFSRELAEAMRGAGCAGINFGVDNGDAAMLRRLGRGYGPEDIVEAARRAKAAGMAVMLDLLLGSPGESRESLARTIAVMRRSAADRVGVAAGVRVYPGTPLAAQLGYGAGAEPAYFLEPGVAPFLFDLLDRLIAGDPRFLFHDPSRPDRNYNYNDNERLAEAIREGYRGAYWDILRRLA